jgi:hypothetical protein
MVKMQKSGVSVFSLNVKISSFSGRSPVLAKNGREKEEEERKERDKREADDGRLRNTS